MRLWTIQPLHVLDEVRQAGTYTCDASKIPLPEFEEQYSWLAGQMTSRVGPPPARVQYPVWAWCMQDGKTQKPDLRRERWSYGSGGEDYVCMELEVPDHLVVLSDFHSWNLVLMNALISETEAEDSELQTQFDSLTAEAQQSFMHQNRARIFDITPLDNGWVLRGSWIQATFWELKDAYIQHVYPFKTARRGK